MAPCSPNSCTGGGIQTSTTGVRSASYVGNPYKSNNTSCCSLRSDAWLLPSVAVPGVFNLLQDTAESSLTDTYIHKIPKNHHPLYPSLSSQTTSSPESLYQWLCLPHTLHFCGHIDHHHDATYRKLTNYSRTFRCRICEVSTGLESHRWRRGGQGCRGRWA